MPAPTSSQAVGNADVPLVYIAISLWDVNEENIWIIAKLTFIVCTSNRLAGWNKLRRKRWISVDNWQVGEEAKEREESHRPSARWKYERPAVVQSTRSPIWSWLCGTTRLSLHQLLPMAKIHRQRHVNQMFRWCSLSFHCRLKVGRWSNGNMVFECSKYRSMSVSRRSAGGNWCRNVWITSEVSSGEPSYSSSHWNHQDELPVTNQGWNSQKVFAKIVVFWSAPRFYYQERWM